MTTQLAAGWVAGSCSLMVNRDNVLGIQFYSIAPDDLHTDMNFVYPRDAGQTFADTIRVTTQTSAEPPNQPRYFGQDQVYADVDPDGAFNLVWPDARGGAGDYTVYSRKITFR